MLFTHTWLATSIMQGVNQNGSKWKVRNVDILLLFIIFVCRKEIFPWKISSTLKDHKIRIILWYYLLENWCRGGKQKNIFPYLSYTYSPYSSLFINTASTIILLSAHKAPTIFHAEFIKLPPENLACPENFMAEDSNYIFFALQHFFV